MTDDSTVVLQLILTRLDTLISLFRQIVGNPSTDFLPDDAEESLWKMFAHEHRRHEHEEAAVHPASDWSLVTQGNGLGPDNPHSAFAGVGDHLVQEFLLKQDLDSGAGAGNSIYGHVDGFQIDEADPEFPPFLLGVHQHELFGFPEQILSWSAYLATL